nr:FAD-dependent oxidoreductase [Neisseriaceae bacterium]
EDQGLRANRVEALKRTVRASFPQVGLLDDAVAWSGLRPSTPKGPPILGRTKYENLWLNIGHGSLGFTLAAGSAAVLTALVSGATAPISLTGLTG